MQGCGVGGFLQPCSLKTVLKLLSGIAREAEGVEHSPAMGDAVCQHGGCARLSSRRAGGAARWWLLLDDDEYETGAGEHGSNSVPAHTASDHALQSISLNQLKLPLLHCFPHCGWVVHQEGTQCRGKTVELGQCGHGTPFPRERCFLKCVHRGTARPWHILSQRWHSETSREQVLVLYWLLLLLECFFLYMNCLRIEERLQAGVLRCPGSARLFYNVG